MDEAPDDTRPDPTRAGLVVMDPGRPVQHYCAVCGAWGSWGYGVDLATGKPGRWFCGAHRPDAG